MGDHKRRRLTIKQSEPDLPAPDRDCPTTTKKQARRPTTDDIDEVSARSACGSGRGSDKAGKSKAATKADKGAAALLMKSKSVRAKHDGATQAFQHIMNNIEVECDWAWAKGNQPLLDPITTAHKKLVTFKTSHPFWGMWCMVDNFAKSAKSSFPQHELCEQLGRLGELEQLIKVLETQDKILIDMNCRRRD